MGKRGIENVIASNFPDYPIAATFLTGVLCNEVRSSDKFSGIAAVKFEDPSKKPCLAVYLEVSDEEPIELNRLGKPYNRLLQMLHPQNPVEIHYLRLRHDGQTLAEAVLEDVQAKTLPDNIHPNIGLLYVENFANNA